MGMGDKRFYMVGKFPGKDQWTYGKDFSHVDDAYAVAEDLARREPSTRYFVYEAVGSVILSIPEPPIPPVTVEKFGEQ